MEHWARAEAKSQLELRSPLDVIGMHRGYLAGLLKGVIASETIETWDEGVNYPGDQVAKTRAWFLSSPSTRRGGGSTCGPRTPSRCCGSTFRAANVPRWNWSATECSG